MKTRACPCCEGGEPLRCPDCGGTDEHPAEHCQDCPQLDPFPAWPIYTNKHGFGRGSTFLGMSKGCTHCGHTGYADRPAYGGSEGKCPFCGKLPDPKVLSRKPPT